MSRDFVAELLCYANWTNDWNAIIVCIGRTSDWKLLTRLCRRKPKMDAKAFQSLIKVYRYIGRMGEKPQAVEDIENLIFDRILVPMPIKNVEEAAVWSKALRSFAVVSKAVEADDEDGLKYFVFKWWQDMRVKSRGTIDIFKQMKNPEMSATECAMWVDMFPIEALLEKGYLEQLFCLGEIDLLLKHGKSRVVIDNWNKQCTARLLSGNEQEKYISFVSRIPAADLKRYLRKNGKNFLIFTVHVDGLRILVKEECFGVIARYAAEFENTAKNFPRWFAEKYSVQEYRELLSRSLDASLKF